MGLIIFLLIASFCIAQGQNKNEDFVDFFLLNGAKSLTDKENFQTCYKQKNEEHNQAALTFFNKTAEAVYSLKKKLGWKLEFNRRILKLKYSMYELGKTVKNYPKKFLEEVNGRKSGSIEQFMKKYKVNIVQKLYTLIKVLNDIDTPTTWSLDRTRIRNCIKAIKNEMITLTNTSKDIMGELEKCVNDKNQSIS